jgi:hypothetical protein
MASLIRRDLSPIEQLFANLKHCLRRDQPRPGDAVCNAIAKPTRHRHTYRMRKRLCQRRRPLNLISSRLIYF